MFERLSLGEIIFVINLFNLGVTPLRVFFFALINVFEAKVSLERINNILYYPDENEDESLFKFLSFFNKLSSSFSSG